MEVTNTACVTNQTHRARCAGSGYARLLFFLEAPVTLLESGDREVAIKYYISYLIAESSRDCNDNERNIHKHVSNPGKQVPYAGKFLQHVYFTIKPLNKIFTFRISQVTQNEASFHLCINMPSCESSHTKFLLLINHPHEPCKFKNFCVLGILSMVSHYKANRGYAGCMFFPITINNIGKILCVDHF